MTTYDPNQRLPTLRVYPRDLSPHVLVVGDPRRARAAAELMTDVTELGNNREFVTLAGEFRGQRLSVASHGVGAAGANVCFIELLRAGVKVLVRAGTCGAMAENIEDGEFIIATGAVREDAATEQLMPLAYPAIADRHVVGALVEAAHRNGHAAPHIGLAVTVANLYDTPIMPAQFLKYADYGVLGVEMELAALLVLARMYGARAGGVLTSDGNVWRKAGTTLETYEPHREVVEQGKRAMLRVALEALAELAGKEIRD